MLLDRGLSSVKQGDMVHAGKLTLLCQATLRLMRHEGGLLMPSDWERCLPARRPSAVRARLAVP